MLYVPAVNTFSVMWYDFLSEPVQCLYSVTDSASGVPRKCGSRGGDRGSGPPLKNYKNIGFLSNTGPDPLKITKLSSQHSMLSHYRHASETPFKWRLAGGLMMASLIVVFGSSFLSSTKKTLSKLDPL